MDDRIAVSDPFQDPRVQTTVVQSLGPRLSASTPPLSTPAAAVPVGPHPPVHVAQPSLTFVVPRSVADFISIPIIREFHRDSTAAENTNANDCDRRTTARSPARRLVPKISSSSSTSRLLQQQDDEESASLVLKKPALPDEISNAKILSSIFGDLSVGSPTRAWWSYDFSILGGSCVSWLGCRDPSGCIGLDDNRRCCARK